MAAIEVKEKCCGFDFWKKKLNSAKFVVAPMVDQSELAWRMLSRKYGAELCYTPMLHASVFVRDARYRRESMASCAEDRPLIVQFCANKPETLLKAAQLVENDCEAVDLNLGCPQSIAKRGHYGAFLQDEWSLLHDMVSLCAKELKVPITCKIRIFEDVNKSIQYAQMLEKAGAELLTVHGRTREQKGSITGLANWDQITAIRKSVNVPMFANGNIQYLEDVHRCLAKTGVQGVMSAEGNLHNPALFSGLTLPVWQLASEYLELVRQYPCPLSYVRGHLFKILHHAVLVHIEVRDELSISKSVEDLQEIVNRVETLSQADVKAYEEDPSSFIPTAEMNKPYWLCQPYVRPDPDQPVSEEKKQRRELAKRPIDELLSTSDNANLSKNKLKKLRRNAQKSFESKPDKFPKCSCGNPKGLTCEFDFCRSCCRARAYKNSRDCRGHRFVFGSSNKQVAALNNKPVNVERTPLSPVDDEMECKSLSQRDEKLNGTTTPECNVANNMQVASTCNGSTLTERVDSETDCNTYLKT